MNRELHLRMKAAKEKHRQLAVEWVLENWTGIAERMRQEADLGQAGMNLNHPYFEANRDQAGWKLDALALALKAQGLKVQGVKVVEVENGFAGWLNVGWTKNEAKEKDVPEAAA